MGIFTQFDRYARNNPAVQPSPEIPQSEWSRPDWQNPLLTRAPEEPRTPSRPPSTSAEPGGVVGPGPRRPFDLQQFRSGWESGAAGFSVEDLNRYISGWEGVRSTGRGKGDKIILPDGQVIDMIFATGSPQARAQWLPIGGGGGGSETPQAAPPQAAPPQDVVGSRGVESGPGKELFELLMRRAKQGETPDPRDPIIRSQVDAFRAQQQRSGREYLADVAERGGPNANIAAEQRMTAENVGQRTSAMEAALLGREVSARRHEIESALSGAAEFLTAEQRLQLQNELARLDAAQQESQFKRRLTQQESEFDRTLAQRGYEFDINDLFRNSPLAY